MALIKADRVKEISTSETTANFILGGAATGYRTFSSVCAVGDTFYYAISNQSNGEWEVGLGTYGVPNILERTTVHASSNAGNKVNFSSGTKECFISATKAWLDTFITQTSGTTNYVAKSTGTGTIGNSQITDNGTNVGIGVSPAVSKLDVGGTISSNSKEVATYVAAQSTLYIGGITSSNTAANVAFRAQSSGGSDTTYMYIAQGGNVCIGTTTPVDSLHVYNATYPYMRFTNAASTSGLRIGVEGSSFALVGVYQGGMPLIFSTSGSGSGGYNERMRVDSSGYVGINEASPGARLQVTTTAAAVKGLIVKGASAQSANLQEWQNSNSNALTVISSTGNIGVGTSSPDVNAAIHVKSQEIRIETTGVSDASRLRMINAAGGNWYVGAGSWDGGSNLQLVQGSATNGVNITTAGNVGIGTASPSVKLDVAGAIKTTGTGFGGASAPTVSMTNSTATTGRSWAINSADNGLFQIFDITAGNATRMAINSSGNVGIGDYSPSAQLHVATTAAATKGLIVKGASGQSANLQEWQNNNGISLLQIPSTGDIIKNGGTDFFITTTNGYGIVYQADNNGHKFQVWAGSWVDRMVILEDGNVGIGTTSPAGQLHTQATASGTKALVVRGASGQSANLQEWQNNSGTALAYINSSGILVVPEIYAPIITDVGGVGYYKQYFITRTLPDTVGDYVELLEYNHTVGTRFKIDVMTADYPYWDNAAYEFNVVWDGASSIMPPKFRYHRNTSDFVLEKAYGQSSPYQSRLRLRRIGAKSHASSTTVRIRVEVWATSVGGFPTDASATGTSTLSNYGSDQSFCNPVLQAPPQLVAGSGTSISLSPSQYLTSGNNGEVIVYGNVENSDGNPPSTLKLYGGTTSGDCSRLMLAHHMTWNNGTPFGVKSHYELRRTLPTAVGDYIELFKHGWGQNAHFRITIITSRSSWIAGSITKVYEFQPSAGSFTAVFPPTYSWGGDSFDDYVLERVFTTGVEVRYRLRRTASTSTIYAYVHVELFNGGGMNWIQMLSGTGTSTVGNNYFDQGFSVPSLSAPASARMSGNASDLSLYGASANGTGNGGNILLQAGAYSNSGSNGKVIVRGLASNTANLQEWQNNAGSLLSAVNSAGDFTNTGGYSYTEKFGNAASVSNSYATAIGYGTTAGQLSTAVGAFAVASGVTSTAFGADANAASSGGTALGRSANAAGGAVAVGFNASASGSNGIAVGRSAIAGTGTAIGYNFTGSGVGYTSLCASTDGRYATGAIDVFAGDGVNTNANISRQHSILGTWATATYASRLGRVQLRVNDFTTDREAIRYESDGANALTSIGGAAVIASTTLAVQPAVSGNKGVVVKGASGQSANLQEWQNSAGTVLAYVDSAGKFRASTGYFLTSDLAGFVINGNRIGIGTSVSTIFGCEYGNYMRPNIVSYFPDGAGYIGTIINTSNTYANATAKLVSVQNNGTEKFAIFSDGSMAGVDARITGSIQITSNTPAAFTVDQNDLALTASGFQRLSGTAARNITGIAPPSGSHVDGRMMRIYNVGSFNLTLKHNSTASSAPNRFFNVQSIDIIIGPNDYAELIYDGTNNGSGAAGWRVA